MTFGGSLNIGNDTEDLYGKKLLDSRLAIQQHFLIQILCYQILYSNAIDLKLGSSTYFFLLFLFLLFVKC